jgi:DNA-binding transcriptional ArsR family regulator
MKNCIFVCEGYFSLVKKISLTRIKACLSNQRIGGKMVDLEEQNESLEESIFKTLSNQKRRDILRFIGEKKQASFTEIKNAVGIEDSSSFSYHLNSLSILITQKAEKYSLSELGQDAYDLIVKTNAYTSTNVVVNYLRRQLTLLILANAILWLIGIVLTRQIAGQLDHNATFVLVALWLISNGIIYSILRETKTNH